MKHRLALVSSLIRQRRGQVGTMGTSIPTCISTSPSARRLLGMSSAAEASHTSLASTFLSGVPLLRRHASPGCPRTICEEHGFSLGAARQLAGTEPSFARHADAVADETYMSKAQSSLTAIAEELGRWETTKGVRL